MNVRDIIEGYLRANGYDGLFVSNNSCSCDMKLFGDYCNRPTMNCMPGYKAMQDDGDWIIRAEKPEVKK